MLPGSVIIKGKSLNILSSQEGRAAGAAQKRRQPPTAPLPALRGHNTREPLLGPPKRQLSYHLGGEGRGAGGRSAPAPDGVQTSTSHLRKKVHAGRLHRHLGSEQGRLGGCLRNVFICTRGEMFLHLLMERNLDRTQVFR